MELVKIICAIILPPLGVFLQVGIGLHFWINIVLTILGYIPGIAHAVWVVGKKNNTTDMPPVKDPPMTIHVGIYLYNEIEVLDFAGPFEVFSTASRVKARLNPDASALFNVFTVGETAASILARGGLQVTPKYTIIDHPKIDLLLIPGGIVSDELEKERLISWIQDTSGTATITASVCTGAFLLAKAGLLQSKAATTHWEDIADLKIMFPDIEIKNNARWVDEGDVVTAAGISAGIDMSLHLVSRFDSEDLSVRTARQMEYDWEKI